MSNDGTSDGFGQEVDRILTQFDSLEDHAITEAALQNKREVERAVDSLFAPSPKTFICKDCKDPQKIEFAKGMCEACYRRDLRRRKKRIKESVEEAVAPKYLAMDLEELLKVTDLDPMIHRILVSHRLEREDRVHTNVEYLQKEKELELIYEFIHLQGAAFESQLRAYLVSHLPRLLPLAPQE